MSLTREEIQNEIIAAITANNEAKKLCNEALCHANNELNKVNSYNAKKSSDDYLRGLEDAWEFVRKIILNSTDGGLSHAEFTTIFNSNSAYPLVRDYTIHELMNKLKEAETEKAVKLEIGDAVMVVSKTDPEEKYTGVFIGGSSMAFIIIDSDSVIRTYNKGEYNVCKLGIVGVDITGVLEKLREYDAGRKEQ